jgi:hypothetical protein
MYKEQCELTNFGEIYDIVPVNISVHNLIIGTPYLDFGGNAYVRNKACPNELYAEITFHKRGWSQESYYRFEGSVYSAAGKVAYRIEGRWNLNCFLTNAATGERELVWTKPPYPENSEYMYGMSTYSLQFNYLPDSMRPFLPPTDSRFRPD